MEVDDISKKQSDALRALFKDLAPENRETIHFLAAHFQLVHQHANKNKMDSYALQTTLSIMLGQTIAKYLMASDSTKSVD